MCSRSSRAIAIEVCAVVPDPLLRSVLTEELARETQGLGIAVQRIDTLKHLVKQKQSQLVGTSLGVFVASVWHAPCEVSRVLAEVCPQLVQPGSIVLEYLFGTERFVLDKLPSLVGRPPTFQPLGVCLTTDVPPDASRHVELTQEHKQFLDNCVSAIGSELTCLRCRGNCPPLFQVHWLAGHAKHAPRTTGQSVQGLFQEGIGVSRVLKEALRSHVIESNPLSPHAELCVVVHNQMVNGPPECLVFVTGTITRSYLTRAHALLLRVLEVQAQEVTRTLRFHSSLQSCSCAMGLVQSKGVWWVRWAAYNLLQNEIRRASANSIDSPLKVGT
jgi:hypothetical protein